jgi:hypothetical protein
MMSTSATRIMRVALLVSAAIALAAAAAQMREKRMLADQTVGQIEDQISALDPATRAAVVARLGADAARQAKERIDK